MSSRTGSAARAQLARLLTLVPYLHASDGEVRLDEAARLLDVPERTLVKDLRLLYMCGLPGGYPDDLIDVDVDALTDPGGDRVIRVSNADYLSRPLRLTPTEATALIVALRALRTGTDTAETIEVVDRALAKLEQAAADVGSAAVDPGQTDPETARLRSRLERAVADSRQVRISYWVPTRDETGDRVVDPHRLVSWRGADYLEGWCHHAGAPRSFRLDRIGAVEQLPNPIRTVPDPEESLTESFFARGDGLLTVTLRLAPPARWVAEYAQVARTRPGPDGTLDADLLVADPRWLSRLLLRIAPHAEILAVTGEPRPESAATGAATTSTPRTFTDTLRAEARATLTLYGITE